MRITEETNNSITMEDLGLSTSETIERVCELIVEGTIEEGAMIIEYQGQDIEIVVRLPQE